MIDSSVRRSDADPRDSVGDLVQQASQQVSELVRAEMRLAKAEMTEKGKRAGLGGGMFGGAALFGATALLALIAAGIAAIALVLPVWAACLIGAGVLLALAGVLALVGKREFQEATPAAPQQTIDSVKADVDEVKERVRR